MALGRKRKMEDSSVPRNIRCLRMRRVGGSTPTPRKPGRRKMGGLVAILLQFGAKTAGLNGKRNSLNERE